MESPALTPLRLNGRTVDLQRGAVTDDAGHAMTLRPQAAEVLKVLAAQPGKLVTKDELMRLVWAGIAVTDDSLVQCITEIRKALGDEKHTIVKTVLKRGYVLEPETTAGTHDKHWLPWRWTALAAGVAGAAALAGVYLFPMAKPGAEPPAIAVLPFENLSVGSQWDRFADGMTEDIITDLARFRDIPVIARTSTEVYRGKPHDVRAIGSALDVDYVLEGSLRINLHWLRVTAQLVNAKTGEHVWSERYDDRNVGDFFAIQDEITEKIAATLTGWQSPISQEQKAAARRKNPADLNAYDYWLLGAAEKHKITPASMIEARKLFEKGLALDPGFQPMVRDLGYTYTIELWMGSAKDRDLNLRRLDELSARAIELDPQDPLAWHLRGNVSAWEGDRETQRERFERALSLGPNNADLLVLAASDAAAVGVAERGPELADRALRLNPHHPHWWDATLTPAYVYGGAFAKAYPLARKLGLESPRVAAYQAMIAAELGKTDEAAAAVAAVVRLDPGWRAETTFDLPVDKDREFMLTAARKAGLPVCATAEQLAGEFRHVRPSPQCEKERALAASN